MSTPEGQRWLVFAEQDLRAAEAMLGRPEAYPRHVCWLAQQAAEKAIKAIFVFLEIEFPYTHDLDRLRDLLPDDWRVKGGFPDLAELTEWAVEARYPRRYAGYCGSGRPTGRSAGAGDSGSRSRRF